MQAVSTLQQLEEEAVDGFQLSLQRKPLPHSSSSHHHVGLSDMQVMIAIFKCVVGVGSFFLPYGIKQAGLYGGIIGLFFFLAMTMYINNMIMDAKLKFGGQAETYVDLTKACFGPFWGRVMFWAIVLGCVGTCSVYIVTCSELLRIIFPNASFQVLVLIIGLAEMIVSCFPFNYFVFTSYLGNFFLFVAIITVLIFSFQIGNKEASSSSAPLPYFVWETYPEFFALAGFLLVQPPTLFPIANAMRNPEKFNRLSTTVHLFIGFVNIVFAVAVFLVFGNQTREIILQNICSEDCNSGLALFAHIGLVFDVFFTFPVILSCATDIITRSLFGTEQLRNRPMLKSVVVAIITLLALVVPDITDLVNILSGISTAFTAFIFGPLIYLKAFRAEIKHYNLTLAINMMIMFIGLLLGGYAMVDGIRNAIGHWRNVGLYQNKV